MSSYPYDIISLSHRVEFNNLWNKEKLFPYQEYARRYMAPHTQNESILLFHSLGSGKTLTCISISVDHYEASKTKSIIITKSMHGHYIFRNEIEKYKQMHGDFNDRDIFSMNSYIEFHNRLREMTDAEVNKKYSDKLIIMDEIHNIKYQKINVDTVYQQLLRLVTLSDRTRIVLATATPMTDNVEQFESILNLFTDRNIAISYNATTQNIARTIFHGKKLYPHFFPLVEIPMSNHQKHVYTHLYNQNINNDVYRSLSQVSLFCSLDGLYGRRVMKQMMFCDKLTKRIVMSSGKHKEITYTSYRIRDEYIPDITDDLSITSCKYNYLLSHINQDSGTFFIFIEDVLGSGIIILLEILRQYGYEAYLGEDITHMKPIPRYTFCVGTTDLCPNMEDRIEGFNHPSNKDGQYVKIMIGSRVLGESITLRNVRNFHCIIPHWNDGIVIQALGRVVRSQSHEDLSPENRYVNVHIYCSVIENGTIESIDQKKIRISDIKQSKIDHMVDILKRDSIERYTLHNPVKHEAYYVDGFIRHYLYRYIPMLTPHIESMFRIRKSYTIQEIQDYLNIDTKITRNFLIKCIVDNIPLLDSTSMLRTFGDRVFVLPRDDSRPYITYNTPSHKVVSKRLIPIRIEEDVNDENIVLQGETSYDMLLHIRQNMNASHLEYFVEHTLDNPIFLDLMRHVVIFLNGTKVHTLCYTKNYEVSYKASIPIPTIASGLRIYNNNHWETCSPEDENGLLLPLRNHFEQIFTDMDSKYPVYGIISTIDMKMRLSTKMTEQILKDKRMKHRGRMISTLTKVSLFILHHILSHDEVYEKICQNYLLGKRYNNLQEIYKEYNNNSDDIIIDSNSELIHKIEELIIKRNIFIII